MQKRDFLADGIDQDQTARNTQYHLGYIPSICTVNSMRQGSFWVATIINDNNQIKSSDILSSLILM